MSPELPAPAPEVTPETEPFWAATAEGRLVLAHCDGCGLVLWYPKSFCSACGTTGVSWVEASGRGTVYSFSVIRKGQGAYRDAGPYALAYVELDEGPRVMTNVVECDLDALQVGQPVEVVFAPTGDGHALPRFRPV